MKNRISISLSGRILRKEEIEQLIILSDKNLREAIELAYYEGKKINKIESSLKISKRTLQRKLNRVGKKFGFNITFETIRHSCLIRLFNEGYTAEYISEFMKYSRKDTILFRRKEAGYITPKLRYKILKRDDFKCKLCSSIDKLHVDHIIPVIKGGKTIESNLQTLCSKCNLGKGIY